MRTTTAIPILLSAAFALGACGGDEAAGGGDDRAGSNRDAALDFARCMRENGVDMPDPRVGERGGIVIGGQGSREVAPPSPEVQRKAQAACREHLERMRPPEGSDERREEFRERALAHARCMREQGIDFPDPQFGEGGALTMHAGEPGDGLDPRSPKFREALETCRAETGGGPIVEAAPGGDGP